MDTGRLRRVAELAADKAGWGRKLPTGHGLGIAAHRSFVSYIATVVEVAVDNKGNLSVPRVDTSDRLRLLCQSGAYPFANRGCRGDGALARQIRERSHSKTGASSRATSTTIRSSGTTNRRTVTNTHIVENGIEVPASGVGEPGVPPFTPALL